MTKNPILSVVADTKLLTNATPVTETSATEPSHPKPLTIDEIQLLTHPNHLPKPYPAMIAKATFKQSPADFKVDEVMDITFSEEGEHLWMLIQKTGMNTIYLAEQLAKWANIPKRDVGYSGLKDRHAVTTQWFSLRIPNKQLPKTDFRLVHSLTSQPTSQSSERVEVIAQHWHSKKLNRGTHKANHFVITLRDVQLNDALATTQQEVNDVLGRIALQGVPNYFGPQRFGRQGNNIIQALEWFETNTINGRKPHPKKSRDIQSLLLSAARSAIFNQIVAWRVNQDNWNKGIDGEVYNLDGSGSVFASEGIDETLAKRVASGDIHPTAPLWGLNNTKVASSAKALEETVMTKSPILLRLAQGLETKDIKVMRRSTRLTIANFKWQWSDKATLILEFSLPTGTFATSVLNSFALHLEQ